MPSEARPSSGPAYYDMHSPAKHQQLDQRAEPPIGALTPLEAGTMDRKVTENGNEKILEAGSRERQEGSGLERDNLDLEQAEIHWEVGKEHRDKVGSPEER